ncbi:unannotated protein [freshwater metagenome]|uniref:Unannotated protein n=1 Tax=freshwater metagenome TaxID=449393 RepID=A0A6J7RU80_9ZZZZ|nr:hypothetical protein [Actinomycetota bacterium]
MNTWVFIFMMIVLKIPILALFGIVWWAIKQKPEKVEDSSGGGGSLKPVSPHPRSPLPRSPRRGPHGDPASPAPDRMRVTTPQQHDRA